MKSLDILQKCCKNFFNLEQLFQPLQQMVGQNQDHLWLCIDEESNNLKLKRFEISLEGGVLGALVPWGNYDTKFSICGGLPDLANLPHLLTLG